MRARIASALVAMGLGAVLLTAALLEPATAGHGTHTQLGLGTCSFLAATGVPCPMCGATTSFTLMAHLQPIQAVVNQPFAALLFLMSTGLFGVATAEAVDPRERWATLARVAGPRESELACGFLVLMTAGWAYKFWLMSP